MKKIIIWILIFVLGYLVGEFAPWNLFSLNDTENLKRVDYYTIIINSFATLATMAAVFVALLLAEIRALFKKVKYDISFQREYLIEKLNNEQNNEKALKYYNSIVIKNKGNENARDCEMYLINVEFTGDDKIPESIFVDREPINWLVDTNKTSVYIPIKGEKILRIFELYEPQTITDPSGNESRRNTNYAICGLGVQEAKKGTWKLTYSLESTNAPPFQITIELYWCGVWKNRLDDMKKRLTVKIIN